MGLWQRFTMIFRVKAHDAGTGREPRRDARLQLPGQLEMLQKTKRGLADVVTAKKRLQHQTQGLEQSVVKLDGQAARRSRPGATISPARRWSARCWCRSSCRGSTSRSPGSRSSSGRWSSSSRSSREGRGLPHPEGGDQGAVLGGRGTGADRRGDGRAVARSCRTSVPRRQRAQDQVEQMRARAAAVEELVSSGALDEVGSSGTSTLDRQIAALSADAQVDVRAGQDPRGAGGPGRAGRGAEPRGRRRSGPRRRRPSNPPQSRSPSSRAWLRAPRARRTYVRYSVRMRWLPDEPQLALFGPEQREPAQRGVHGGQRAADHQHAAGLVPDAVPPHHQRLPRLPPRLYVLLRPAHARVPGPELGRGLRAAGSW